MTKTHTMRSRLISLVLVLVMVLGCLPLSALAADPALESEFQSNSVTYGDFAVTTRVADGYQLQTVGSQDSKQNVGMRMQIYYKDTSTPINDEKLRIELYDENGDCFRVVDVSGISYTDSTSGFSANATATSYAVSFGDAGQRVYTADPVAWRPKVTGNSDSIFVTGILVELTGSGSFPLKASLSNLGGSIDVGDGNIQTLGNFDIKAYSVDVPTVNLTYNLDATDAYYAYSTVAIQKGEEYPLPTVTPIRDHYTFVGWDSNDDEVANYQPGGIIEAKDLASDKLLTAVWERDTVKFSADHKKLPTGVKFVSSKVMLDGKDITDKLPPASDNTVTIPYGSEVYFTLGLSEYYDPATLEVVVGDYLLAPINVEQGDLVAGTDTTPADQLTNYTYMFKVTENVAWTVRNTLAQRTFVVTMPVGHFNAELVSVNGTPLGNTDSKVSASVIYSKGYSFKVEAETGYEITGVYVNGAELKANAGVYTVKDVKTAQKVEVLVKEIPNYTVTYVVNDKQYTTQVVADGTKVVLPEAPVVTGYTFDGWYTQQSGSGTQFTADSTVSDNITVYAKLTAKTYTIRYNGNGVTIAPSIISEKTYGKPVKLDATVLTRDGYTFLGWSRNEKAAEATYAAGDIFTEEITEDITLYAVWKANTYTVTLPTGTGYTVVAHSENVVGWGKEFKFYVYVDRGYVENTPVVSVNGVTLRGIDRGTNASGTKTYEYTITGIQENQVVNVTVAKNKTYTVTFEAKGKVYQTQEVEYGYCATAPVAPEVMCYTFLGWSENPDYEKPESSTLYTFDTPVTKDITLFAVLKPIYNTVTLPTAGTGYTVTPAGQKNVFYNSNFSFQVTVQDGYSDANMFVVANGAPLYYNSKTYDETAKTTTYDYKLYNVKTPYEVFVNGVERKTVTITYIDNGGVGGPGQQVANYYVTGASDNTTVSQITPTRDGYVFKGWAKTNNTTQVDYSFGDTLQETTDITLYAVWQKAKASIEITADVEEQYEGKDIVLTATVTDAGGNAVTSGSVEFFRVTADNQSISLGTAPVSGGKATMTVQASAWSKGAADRFSAKFIPAEGFGYGEATTGTNYAYITIKSTAIAWELAEDAENPGTNVAQNALIVEGTMTAGSSFTLKLPTVVTKDGKGTAAYTVQWQEKKAGQDWQNVGTDGKSYTVTEYVSGTVYRAILTPADPYTKAQAYNENGTEVADSYVYTLVTAKTSEVGLQATATTLEVTDTNDLNGTTAEFEGQDVTVTASVTYGGKAVTEGYVQFYKNEVKAGNEIGEPVPVNAESGKASLTWTTSAYADTGANTDTYTAKYLGTERYQESSVAADGAKTVAIRSTAIAWQSNSVVTVTKDNAAYMGTLKAGETYTITIAQVNERATATKLTVGKDYTVQWYSVTNGVVTKLDNVGSGDSITVTPATSGMTYYAEVYPMTGSNYTKAYQAGAMVNT